MLKADLHTHTKASNDSRTSVPQLLRAAKRAGLHAIAITDHDSTASHAEAAHLAPRYGLQVVPGVEITARDGTHILGYFLSEAPPKRALSPLEVISFIRARGGVSCLAHPYRSDPSGLLHNVNTGSLTKKEMDEILDAVDLVEAVNFKSTLRGEAGGEQAAGNRKTPFLASTDAHYPIETGKAFTAFSVPPNAPLTPSILKHGARKLWTHPIPQTLVSPPTLPLANFEPKVSSIARLKRVLPGPIIPLLGRGLYRWQAHARKRAKIRQMTDLVAQSPEPKAYTL